MNFACYLAILHNAIRSLDKSELIDLSENGKRGDKSDIRSFRSFDRAKSAVMGIVNVAHFESCALSCKTTWSESRHTTLMRHFCKRIRLIHELRKLVCSEECINDARYGACIDKISRTDLLIMNTHAFTDRTRHAGKSDVKLLSKL